MENVAFIFQGMGAEVHSLLETLTDFQKDRIRSFCSEDQILMKYEMNKYFFEVQEDSETIKEWLAIYTIGCVIYETYINKGYLPCVYLGYSLGLIVAVVCAGAINFSRGAEMLVEIENYKSSHIAENETMAVVIGKSFGQIKDMIARQQLQNCVYAAIDNNEDCITVSGSESGIDEIISLCISEGVIKAEKLKTQYAFHCPFSTVGIEPFADFINHLEMNDLTIPVFSVYNQRLIYNSAEIKAELVRNMSEVMLWRTTIMAIKEMGIEDFAEIGLDGGLTKLSRSIDLDLRFTTIKKINQV